LAFGNTFDFNEVEVRYFGNTINMRSNITHFHPGKDEKQQVAVDDKPEDQ